MPLPAEAATRQLAKWQAYFNSGTAPWDSGRPGTALVQLATGAFAAGVGPLASGSRCVEVGCGTGANVRWLAQKGYPALGVDLVAGVVEEAARRAKAEDNGGARFVQGDVFCLPAEIERGAFDFVYDAQCFHCLREHGEAAAVRAVAELLKPGGLMLVLTGNDAEPPCGPAVLSKTELLAAFTGGEGGKGLFELVAVRESRFDPTPAYDKLPRPPLSWECLLRRTDVAVSR